MSFVKRIAEQIVTPTKHIKFIIRRPINIESIEESIDGSPDQVVYLAVRRVGPSPNCRLQRQRILGFDFRDLTNEEDGSNRAATNGFVRLSKAGQPVPFRAVFCTKHIAGQCSYGSITVLVQ